MLRRRPAPPSPNWSEVLAAFVVSHGVGDYLLQTDWQARHKRGGLGSDRTARRALVTHVSTYTLSFVPALAWITGRRSLALALRTGAIIFIPHLVQDDGRLLSMYAERVKGLDVREQPHVGMWVDQSFHLVALFLTAHAAARAAGARRG